LDKAELGSDTPAAIAAERLAGPLKGLSKDDKELRRKIFLEFQTASSAGHNHLKWTEWQLKYGSQGLDSNIVVPFLMLSLSEDQPCVTNMVLLNNHKDCARIARTHVKKAPNFTPILAGSVISTTDNDHWRKQRSYLTGAFMPTSSLAHIFDKSVERAKVCRERLREMSEGGQAPIDMSDFYLHEAQAQLQLALFGMDEKFMDRTNAMLRNSFAGRQTEEKNYVTNFLLDLLEQMDSHEKTNSVVTLPRPGEAPASYSAGDSRTVGPLSKVISSSAHKEDMAAYEPDFNTRFGNALIFAFAGHDTTGHTMTWLTFELSQHAEYQARVQAEVDALFESLAPGEVLEYRHCRQLPFLSRCVMETLRLWPAVPNGTFRELQFDDVVVGPDGKDVELKKGTYVQVCTWSRHRNKDLWGPDADQFNPDREFTDDEIWGGDAFSGYNPSSQRFSPFTFPPRDCLGKNFAQMEMRTILAHLFRDFTFTLAAPTLGYDRSTYLGINRGTMGPEDNGGGDVRSNGTVRSRYGMHCFATPRGV
jgi:cytochrome P450